MKNNGEKGRQEPQLPWKPLGKAENFSNKGEELRSLDQKPKASPPPPFATLAKLARLLQQFPPFLPPLKISKPFVLLCAETTNIAKLWMWNNFGGKDLQGMELVMNELQGPIWARNAVDLGLRKLPEMSSICFCLRTTI